MTLCYGPCPLLCGKSPNSAFWLTTGFCRPYAASDSISTVGNVLKLGFLVAFFGFLRQSNLTPPSPRAFDPTCRDVTVQARDLVIRLKWSKTMQAAGTPAAITIPAISCHPLNPVASYQAILYQVPTCDPKDPLLILPTGRPQHMPQLQQAFHAILSTLDKPAHLYSLHSL